VRPGSRAQKKGDRHIISDWFILGNAEADLTPQMRKLVNLLWGEWKTVEQQIEVLSLELERVYLRKIPIHGARAAVLRIKRD
jgi:hypothetical protein